LALPADAEKLLEERKEQCKEQQRRKGHHNDGGDARKSKDAKGVAEGNRVCMCSGYGTVCRERGRKYIRRNTTQVLVTI